MTVDHCSIESYHSLGATEDTQMALVLETVRQARHPSGRDIARLAGIERSSATARLNKLEKDGLIAKMGVKVDPFTKKTVNWYGII